MSQFKRTTNRVRQVQNKLFNNGPYLAEVISHADPTFMGNLQVRLLKGTENSSYDSNNAIVSNDGQTFIARCAMPFYGNSPINNATPGSTDYADAQTSYGMWFVPPDVGVTVIVTFINGDPDLCFWIGCVPALGANAMIPGIAANTKTRIKTEERRTIPSAPPLLPGTDPKVADISVFGLSTDDLPRVMHPITHRFVEQGLLADDVRGTTTSSARREAPSAVFGISTPGPYDFSSATFSAGTAYSRSTRDKTIELPKARFGGTQFIMDDGDPTQYRKGPASTTKQEYTSRQRGDNSIPASEYTRIRTRTGHQILLHNSEDLIYIGNARGTTWVEMTSNGKIDIYAQDSISIHSEQDLNFRAGRDVNFEAGNEVKIKSHTGQTTIDSAKDLNLYSRESVRLSSDDDLNITSDKRIRVQASSDFNLTSDQNKFTAARSNEFSSAGQFVVTASSASIIGFSTAQPASSATKSRKIEPATIPLQSGNSEWAVRYEKGTIKTILGRVPMHEPWQKHENIDPMSVAPEKTKSRPSE